MIGYVTLLFMLVSTVSFFMAPMTFSRPFCVWEMITFLLASFFFLQHKIRRNGIICFDTFFIPSFFLINYCHAVFIFPDDKFLPPFLFPTNTDLISYALAVAQLGISFYMLGNVFFEKEVPEHRRMKIDIPEMAVNRAAVVALVASFSVFCYVIVLRMAASFQHLYPRLMAMIVALIVLSWFFQAQHLEPGDDSPKGLLRRNKLNILSTALFSISQLFVGSRGVVLFLVFMLLLVINTFYFKIRFKVLLPAILIGILGMAILGITRVSSYSVASADFGDMVKYGFEVVMESPNILWLLLTDFVVNAKTLYDSVDYVQLHGYMMGKSYIQYLFVFLPMGGTFFTKLLTGLDMDEVSTGVILTVFSDATYGLGTNMVGDLYMNFSYIGVLVMMFLLGILVAMVEFPETKYQFYVALALFAECIFLVRADIFTWITFFVFFLIFDWIMRIHIHYAENSSD